MLDMWTNFIRHMAILSFFLITATILRSKLKFLQIFYVPNSIIAGFLGLILSYQVLNLLPIPDNILQYITIPPEKLGNYIYHFLGITFIAISLKKHTDTKGRKALQTGFTFAFGYGIQAFLGFGLALFIFNKIYPQFNPLNGVLAQLGFSNSPAVAFNVAERWKEIVLTELGSKVVNDIGLNYSGTIGLTFGAIGFLIASIFGIILINYGVKKGYTKFLNNTDEINTVIKQGYIKDINKQKEAGKLTTPSEAIDSFTVHIAIVLLIYMATFALLKLYLFGISFLPDGIKIKVSVITNFYFIIGALLAMIVKNIMKLFKADFILDNGICSRIAGFSVDFMVTSALAAISMIIVIKFIIPIVVISGVLGIITFIYCVYLGSRSFEDLKFERIVTIFSIATGSMATGMALLRVMDPEYKSPIASEIMYGSGIVFFLTMPIMAFINVPLDAIINGNKTVVVISFIAIGIYTLIITILWRIFGNLKFTNALTKFWNIEKVKE